MSSWRRFPAREEVIDAYVDGEADGAALEPQACRLLDGLREIHTSAPSASFEASLSASLRASADHRRGRLGWAAAVADSFQGRRGALRMLATAAALLMAGLVIGVMLPIHATARPSASQSRLAHYAPVRPGWDDLVRVPGGSGGAPTKSLLASSAGQTKNGITVTVRDVVLGFGPGGQAVDYQSSYDGTGLVVYTQLSVLLEIRNDDGLDARWEANPRVQMVAENMRREELRAGSHVAWEYGGGRDYWPVRGDPSPPTFVVPPGTSVWTVPLIPAEAPRPTSPPTEVDAILWRTPAVSLVVGTFAAGGDTWDYRFDALPLNWERPISDPSLSRWEGRKQ
jgi:hypothetical protein